MVLPVELHETALTALQICRPAKAPTPTATSSHETAHSFSKRPTSELRAFSCATSVGPMPEKSTLSSKRVHVSVTVSHHADSTKLNACGEHHAIWHSTQHGQNNTPDQAGHLRVQTDASHRSPGTRFASRFLHCTSTAPVG